jgi:tetratricopeptide (TPR) repeat protein
VQRDGEQVRVTVQLVDARSDTNLWGDQYDRKIEDLFAMESEVAETIVAQLKSKLSPEAKAAIEEIPTSDLTAYSLYTQANTLIATSVFNVQGTDNLYEAARLLEKAVARDPNFYLAYCRLASAHDQIYLAADHTPARLSQADAALKAAIRLRPDAGETHLAIAEHLYCGYLDFDRARQELRIAERSLPNSPQIFELSGYIDRRQGRWDDSTEYLKRAIDLDPRNLYILQNLVLSYRYERKFAEASALLDRTLQISPNDDNLRLSRAAIELDWRGDPAPLHSLIEEIIAADPGAGSGIADQWLNLAMCERDFDAVDGFRFERGPWRPVFYFFFFFFFFFCFLVFLFAFVFFLPRQRFFASRQGSKTAQMGYCHHEGYFFPSSCWVPGSSGRVFAAGNSEADPAVSLRLARAGSRKSREEPLQNQPGPTAAKSFALLGVMILMRPSVVVRVRTRRNLRFRAKGRRAVCSRLAPRSRACGRTRPPARVAPACGVRSRCWE